MIASCKSPPAAKRATTTINNKTIQSPCADARSCSNDHTPPEFWRRSEAFTAPGEVSTTSGESDDPCARGRADVAAFVAFETTTRGRASACVAPLRSAVVRFFADGVAASPGVDEFTPGNATVAPPGPRPTCTVCGAPGKSGTGPIADGSETDAPTPVFGDTFTVAPKPGATLETGTETGPTVTAAGRVTVTAGGTRTGTETGPTSSADAAPAANHVATTAVEQSTAVRIRNGSHPPVSGRSSVRESLRRISHPVAARKRKGGSEQSEKGDVVMPIGHTAWKRLGVIGLLAAPLAVAGWIFAGVAQGASASPSMEVLPKPTGLKYGQTVEIKGHHLPKGSGSVAATICGLNDASGKAIASPTADDCAGASEIGKLVIVKSWQSNGEFDTKYTLPQSGQKFGKNARFCDKTHFCALVVADANPSAPAYHVQTKIQFTDQAPTTTTTKPKTTTTQKSSPGTSPSGNATTVPATGTTQPGSSSAGSATSSGPGSGSASVSINAAATVVPPSSNGAVPSLPSLPAVTLPASGANPVPAPVAQGLDQVCTQLANAVKQAGGDPSALLTACDAIEGGNGPQQLATVLQSPSLLCIEGASAWQNNQQITDACNEAASALAPVTAQLGGLLAPVLSGS